MEWVEITAKTVEEAKDQALDRLGIHDTDAEFEVLEEPKPGLFGRTRGEARVRARVRPSAPPPKVERRDRSRRKGGGGGGTPNRKRGGSPKQSNQRRDERPKKEKSVSVDERVQDDDGPVTGAAGQGEHVGEFLTGLADAFGVDASLQVDEIDEDTVEVKLVGDDLGVMVGGGGATLTAIHELSKVVVQRRVDGRREGRFRLDIGDYRAKRREALAKFAAKVADQVLDEGEDIALEPMGAADRKVVHDTVNEIDGVSTRSDGEEPRRRVVIFVD